MTTPAALLALLGLLIGSFTNVVIARVPTGQSIITPPSACPECGHRIRARDNIPLISWLALRARCRDCRTPISAQYPLVELTVSAGFFAVASTAPNHPYLWPAGCWMVFLTVALSLIDIRHHRLPNNLTLPSAPVLLALLAAPAIAYGMWDQWLTAAIAGLAWFALFLLMRLIYPAGMGLGDVKLAPVIGVALGWAGWSMVAFGAFATFLLGGVVGGVIVAVAGRRRDPHGLSGRAGVPFGPFMFAGVVAAVYAGRYVVDWYLGLMIGA